MMFVCLALLQLFCASTPPLDGQVFADGFEMYISSDRTAATNWSLISFPNHDASYATSSSYLTDGKVAIPTRIQNDSGTQTTSLSLTLSANIGHIAVTATGLAVVAVLCPNTPNALPVGAPISFKLEQSSPPIALVASGNVVKFNNGATGFIGIIAISPGITFDSLQIVLTNNIGGSTWLAPGANIDIGEVWFGTLQEFKTAADPKIALLGGPTERRSHSNQPWPVTQGRPYRQLTTALPPFSDSTAYSGTNNWQQVLYALASTKAMLVIPRLYTRGSTSSQDANAVNQLTIFGRPSVNAFGAMQGVKDGTGLWTASLTVEEAPP